MSTNSTQYSVIDAMRNGDPGGWQRFQDIYWDSITGWARLKGLNTTEAKDVFQMVATDLHTGAIDRFQPDGRPGSFRRFLRALASNKAVDYIRRNRRLSKEELPEHKVSQDEPLEMDRVWLKGVMGQALRSTRRRVTPLTWEAFRDYAIKRRPVEDVTAELDLTAGQLYQQKSRFMGYLATELIDLLRALDDFEQELWHESRREQLVQEILGSYLREHHEVIDTAVQDELPRSILERVEVLQRILQHQPPPSPGYWLLHNMDKPVWTPLETPFVIGWQQDCELVLDDAEVSEHHARLWQTEGRWELEDLGSTNGTLRNGRKIDRGALFHGDWFCIGRTSLCFVEKIDKEDA